MKNKILSVMITLTMVFLTITGCTVTANNKLTDDTIIDTTNSVNNTESTDSTDSTLSSTTTGNVISVDTVSAVSANTDTESTVAEKVKKKDLDSSWSDSESTKITLKGTTATVSGSGATVSGGTVTITTAGTYVVSGKLSKGQILINAAKEDVVRLVLNGVDITADKNAAIYAAVADKLIIILADGTTNTVTDVSSYTYADTKNEEPDAAIFSKCDLTINGTGSLTVNGKFNNGIGTKDDLIIVSGSYVINAVNHGLRGRDSITVIDGKFAITAGNDGIQSNNDEDTEKGWIDLRGGVYNITSTHDGIQAETNLTISGGEYTIKTGGASAINTSDSYKGLKAVTDITITDGKFIIDSADDSIHTNGNIIISGGSFTISSGDDGIHADTSLTISGGNINIVKSYEGLESAKTDITDGIINIISTDDAINAAGGTDGNTTQFGRFGKDSFAATGDYYINISGGTVSFTAGGDGIDSNRDVNISGGTIIALIKSSADNGAIDCDGTLTVTGGTIIYGGTGIGQTPQASSTQSYAYVSSGLTAGNEITLRKDGKTLIKFTPAINCQYIAFSSPDIISGQSYTVYNGSQLIATVTAGTGAPSGMGGGMGGRRW